jgi:hypothetical protein
MSASLRSYAPSQQEEDYGQDYLPAPADARPSWLTHVYCCEQHQVHSTRDGHLECRDCHARWYPGEYMPPVPRQHAD